MVADGGWDGMGGQPVDIRATDGGVSATTRPPAGGFGFLQSQGPVSGLGDGLVVTAESGDDGVVRGTVRNDLDVGLDDVAVMVGRNAIVEVGRLDVGDEQEFAIEEATVWQGQPASERDVWPDEAGAGFGGGDVIARIGPGGGAVVVERRRGGFGDERQVPVPDLAPDPAAPPPGRVAPETLPPEEPPLPQPPALPDLPAPEEGIMVDGRERPAGGGDDEPGEETVVMAAWSAVMRYAGWNYRPLGQAVAVGWTEELAPPVTATGSGSVERSRSAVVGRATVAPAGARVTDAAVVASTVRGPLTQSADPGELAGVVAFDLPSGVGGRPVDPDRLAIHVPGTLFSTDVWTAEGWVPLPDGPAGASSEVDLPAGAVVAGQVFVRWQHPQEPLQAGRELVVYEKEPA
jgi:hypothetical protein